MIVLAIDTATPFPAVAIVDGDADGALRLPANRQLTEELLPSMDSLLGQCRRRLANVDRLAGLLGPGSFTGIRIGLATLWALARARRIPVESMTTLEAAAETARGRARHVAVLLDAGRGDFWAAQYDLSLPRAAVIREPCLLEPARRGEWLSGADAILTLPAETPAVLPALAAARAVARQALSARARLRPLYLRLPAAEERRGSAAP